MSNIIGHYLMPHPPIIIPDIGKGEEKNIEDTIVSCNAVGKEISSLKPETIIVITPHGTMFRDAVAISDEDSISGDFGRFRAMNVKMTIPIDTEFNEKLNRNCHAEGISAGLVDSSLLESYNQRFTLDHGAMVPLYFVNKYYTDYKLVHITYSMIGNINLYKFGIEIKKTAEELNRKCVIIASGDLSHALKDEGPYSYSPYGEKFDKAILDDLSRGDVISIFNMDENLTEKSHQCGLNSIYVMLGTLNNSKFKGEILSYEGPFGVGYGVMNLKETQSTLDTLKEILSEKEKKLEEKLKLGDEYTLLARQNLIHYFKYNSPITDLENVPKSLLESKHAVFVSLKKFGALRGCIGTILPVYDSVAEEIINNSISAALKDPRFPPVTEDELCDIDISVDVLSIPVKASKEELNPKKYGVIVSKGYKRGLLLPDLEGVDSIEKQLQIACDKGEIDYFDDDYEIEKFEVIRHSESTDSSE